MRTKYKEEKNDKVLSSEVVYKQGNTEGVIHEGLWMYARWLKDEGVVE